MRLPQPHLDGFRTATTFWEGASELLRSWRRDPPKDRARDASGPRWQAWSTLETKVYAYFFDALEALPDPSPSLSQNPDDPARLRARDRTYVLQLIEAAWDLLGVDALEAAAWGIDAATYETFGRSWLQATTASGAHAVTLTPGTLYPVTDIDLSLLGSASEPCSRPAALTRTEPGELPHVRAYKESGFEAVIDFSNAVPLRAIATELETVATGHPNRTFDALHIEWPEPGVAFPVVPADLALQGEHLIAITEQAITDGAQVLVHPELSMTPELVDALVEIVDDAEDTHLVVAGSFHLETGDRRENLAFGLLPQGGRISHRKIKPITDDLGPDRPMKEGISIEARPTLRLYQAEQLRVLILICKDFLDRTVLETAIRLGANLICVPSMSEKTDAFRAQAMHAATHAQAFTVVGCGPLHWLNGSPVSPAAFFGQPVAGEECVVATPSGGVEPWLTTFKIGDSTAESQSC